MGIEGDIFQRTQLLLGRDFIEKAAKARVIVFGVGGVGSWCAESLVRSGIGHITIVDSDRVSVTNINRQLMATTRTVDMVKVDVLRERFLEINPQLDILALQQIYSPETHDSFGLENYDYIIDAIDSLSNKVYLIQQATKTNAVFFSSMGAALKTDPTRIKVAEFWKVQGCPLAAALRSRIKKFGGLTSKFMCVYSDEVLQNRGDEILPPELSDNDISNELKADNWSHKKARINGTTSYMPAMFGMTIASMVVRAIESEKVVM